MSRQLCCLCWLLEALTLERSGKFGPVASCWDAKYDSSHNVRYEKNIMVFFGVFKA